MHELSFDYHGKVQVREHSNENCSLWEVDAKRFPWVFISKGIQSRAYKIVSWISPRIAIAELTGGEYETLQSLFYR